MELYRCWMRFVSIDRLQTERLSTSAHRLDLVAESITCQEITVELVTVLILRDERYQH